MSYNFLLTLSESAAPIVKPANVGDNDASPDNIPSQFLLIRGLEASVTEELFAKGVTKLNKPTGTASQPNPAAAKKGAKVASTTGDANLGAKEGTLRRVLLVTVEVMTAGSMVSRSTQQLMMHKLR